MNLLFVPPLLCSIIFTFVSVADTTTTQTSPLSKEVIPFRVESGTLQNTSKISKTIFRHLVTADDASSLQIQFGRTKLPVGTTLRMTSLLDGAVQHHRSETFKQWRGKSAWFNGSMVIVELVADAGAQKAHVSIDAINVLHNSGEDRTICGANDDRLPSYSDRCARAIPIGCTAWIIDDANHTFLTAGHCASDGIADIDTVEFNVPLSDGGGSIQHPGPEDQYATDPESFQHGYSGIGDDWAYFGCFPNTETGLTPYQAQDDYYILSDVAPPVSGQQITITGYGTVSPPVTPTWNQVQKTHTGPYAQQSGTSIAYQTDTSGGNSGSPVLNEDTGEAIGIHTNGGCDSGGGENWGCAIHNSGLQNALANPLGVCIPNIILFEFPNGIPNEILPNTPTEFEFSVLAGDETPIPDSVDVLLTIDGSQQNLSSTPQGNDLYSVIIPSLSCDEVVSFYITATGDGGSVVTYPSNAPSDQNDVAIGTLVEDVIFVEDFNDGIPTSWGTSGLWNGSSSCAPSGTCDGGSAAYFGITTQCTYDNGSEVTGSLTSPSISLDGMFGDVVLTYCSSLVTENLSGYDTAEVRVNGVTIDEPSETSSWEERTVYISNSGGDSITIEWIFDSVDSLYNDYRGWHVDGVRISSWTTDCDDTATCDGDINSDGSVNVVDLLTVIDQWGTNGSADVNGDGIVDVSDILMLVGNWGACE
jgi:V8-like Glu-specific endopeptidase